MKVRQRRLALVVAATAAASIVTLALATSLLRFDHVLPVMLLSAAFALPAAAVFASVRTYAAIALTVAVLLAAAIAASGAAASHDTAPVVVFVMVFTILVSLGATAATLSTFAVWLVRRLKRANTKRGR